MAATSVLENAGLDFVVRCVARQPAAARLMGNQVDFLPGGPVLVVTFEPASTRKVEPEMERPAWAQRLVQKRGHSLLGVKRLTTDWYRSAELHELFRTLQARGFFAGFSKVVFCGPSMGGYAALSLAAVAPGCTVLAMNPQSTLAPDRVWFDQRFAGERSSAWQGDFVDGAEGAALAARVYVCFDPWQIKDRLHATRLPAHNRIDLRLPFVGHATSQALQNLGLLGPLFDQVVDGTLDAAGFKRMARERARLPDYLVNLASRGMYRPRRLRLLEKALQIEPGHADATEQRRVLLGLPRPVQPRGPDDPPPRMHPRRWPPGLVTADRVPLVYLNIPKAGGTTIQNHLYYIAHGSYPAQPGDILRHTALRRSRNDDERSHRALSDRIDQGAVVFTFVREPARRLFACFTHQIADPSAARYGGVRRALELSWGLRPAEPGGTLDLVQYRHNFACFVAFVEANLAGKTRIQADPHWSPQAPMLTVYRKYLNIDVVGRLENFAADMAQVLHRAGVSRIPDVQQLPWRAPAAAYTFEEVVDAELRQRIEQLYEGDYRQFRYPTSA